MLFTLELILSFLSIKLSFQFQNGLALRVSYSDRPMLEMSLAICINSCGPSFAYKLRKGLMRSANVNKRLSLFNECRRDRFVSAETICGVQKEVMYTCKCREKLCEIYVLSQRERCPSSPAVAIENLRKDKVSFQRCFCRCFHAFIAVNACSEMEPFQVAPYIVACT